MYGLIGKIVATEGHRDELAAILLEGTAGMPGSLSYIVARDAADENALTTPLGGQGLPEVDR